MQTIFSIILSVSDFKIVFWGNKILNLCHIIILIITNMSQFVWTNYPALLCYIIVLYTCEILLICGENILDYVFHRCRPFFNRNSKIAAVCST